MSRKIDEILDVLTYIANSYRDGMSDHAIVKLRQDALYDVARRRSIDPTTVSNKFRRELRPHINNTGEFDKLLIDWLKNNSDELQHALEAGMNHSDAAKIRQFFERTIEHRIEQQVESDLDGMKAEEGGTEGGASKHITSYFERNPRLRAKAIEIHGTTCKACEFNFEAMYGSHGKGYIEVHHLVPLSTLADPKLVNPDTDMVVLCSNCHRMVHRKRDGILSIEELKAIIKQNSQSTKGR